MAEHAIVTLSSTTPTRLTPSGIHSGMDITIQNINTDGFVYIGAEDVSTTNYGYRLSVENDFSLELPGKDAIYAVADATGAQVAVLKTNLEKGS